MDRFETVSSVRQRPLHDDTHGVIEIGLAHLVFNACQPDVAYFHESIPLASHITIVPQNRHKFSTHRRVTWQKKARTDAQHHEIAFGFAQQNEPVAIATGSVLEDVCRESIARQTCLPPAV